MSLEKPSRLRRPWLWLPSRWAHDMAPFLLPLATPLFTPKDKSWRPFEWRGCHFSNPLGIAGGVDKTGASLKYWSQLGAGFVEVGTVTPKPQDPNPGKIMDRDIRHRALWNKMGFPNPGAHSVLKALESFDSSQSPLFVNVGKNRWTPNDQAHMDYLNCMELFKDKADVFVLNLSSPNTKGLRDLLDKDHLKNFLGDLLPKMRSLSLNQPILLKLSPDMEEGTLFAALEISADFVDGWILTNTTKQRYPGHPFDEDQGGVSGEPLRDLSLSALDRASRFKKKRSDQLIVSVGGISSAQDIKERLDRGADLVQVYSSLVFEGPGFFRDGLRQLKSRE